MSNIIVTCIVAGCESTYDPDTVNEHMVSTHGLTRLKRLAPNSYRCGLCGTGHMVWSFIGKQHASHEVARQPGWAYP